jgi:crotonobetainyl-CoA:carnitine CoA-transferase CaiB-like acyl-CoA transferase
MSGALNNIRVLDLSRVLAGPVCTQILGDLGADIIKVEKPGSGDDTRKWGPPFLKDKEGNSTRESAYYLSANRNKRSIALDIKTKEGQKIIQKLLSKSDVLIENFKAGGLEKYGLSYHQLKNTHPQLIYCSITGFGQNGPLAQEPGYDFLAQAMSGLMSITGEPEESPMKVGVALSDVITGLNASTAILAALHHREKTGQGQHIDLSLLDCTLAAMTNVAQYYLTSGEMAPRLGNAHSTIVPYQAFEASDGFLILAIGNDNQFARFCEHIGKEDWINDERFSTNEARVNNRKALIPEIAKIIKEKSVENWLQALREIDVPGGPVNTIEQAFNNPQIIEREMKIKMEHSQNQIELVGSPLKLSKTPVSYRYPPPTCGEQTEEIIKELLD